jgi:hypothetical protein
MSGTSYTAVSLGLSTMLMGFSWSSALEKSTIVWLARLFVINSLIFSWLIERISFRLVSFFFLASATAIFWVLWMTLNLLLTGYLTTYAVWSTGVSIKNGSCRSLSATTSSPDAKYASRALVNWTSILSLAVNDWSRTVGNFLIKLSSKTKEE